MASTVTLYIFNPQTEAMVCVRWLGMTRTRDALRATLDRPASGRELESGGQEVGNEWWGRVTAEEVREIAKTSACYAEGATPEEIARYAQAFPDTEYWWSLERDY